MTKNDWWTAPTVADGGKTVIVTGRRDIDKFRSKGKYKIRVEVSWVYEPDGSAGFPSLEDSKLMEEATEAFHATLKDTNVAVMTGIYTGDGRRDWIFYTMSTDAFGKFLNRALAELPVLPLSIYAENDPDWAEYDEMKQLSEILPGDEE